MGNHSSLREEKNKQKYKKEKDNKFTTGGITIWWNWLWGLCIYENF
ncbi:hypothetical protein ACT7DG_10325 [Bacillus cereus]